MHEESHMPGRTGISRELEFMESDGKPVGETGVHAAQVHYLLSALPVAYREAEVPFASEVVGATFVAIDGSLRLLDARGRVIPGTVLEGRDQGRQEGREQGWQEGRDEGLRTAIRELCRVRFGATAKRLDARVQALEGEATLRAFLARAAAEDVESLL
jgi:hypothetical protein